MEYKKKTIIWESNNEPPKNYIWVRSDGKVYEYSLANRKWKESGLIKLIEVESENQDSGNNDQAHDYSQDYLTLEALEDGNIKFTIAAYDAYPPVEGRTVYYKINDGEWQEKTLAIEGNQADGVSIDVNNGDIIQFKGNNNDYFPNTNYGNLTHRFESDCNYVVYGNIMSMIYGDDFQNQASFPQDSNNAFFRMFEYNSKLISCENLILPATTLTTGCYSQMFRYCTNITKAPVLPARTLGSASDCYSSMFANCTNLSYIKCLGEDFSFGMPGIFADSWVENVAQEGTFVKSKNYSGSEQDFKMSVDVPNGWTLINE